MRKQDKTIWKMDKFTEYFALLLILFWVPCRVDGQCVLPIQGHWTMSRTDDSLEFIGDAIRGWDFPSSPLYITEFKCVWNDTSRFVMRGEATFPGGQHAYVCLDFIEIGTNRAVFVQATKTGPGSIPIYATALFDEDATNGPIEDNICNLQVPYSSHRYNVFVRNGTRPSVPCSSKLQGTFDLATPCTGNGDVCTDTSIVQMTFTGTACTPNPFFYGTNPVRCLFSIDNETATYVTLMNDASFVCVVLNKIGNTVVMSQREKECGEYQSPTSGGDLFSFQKTECPTTTATATTSATTENGGLTPETRNIIIVIAILVAIAIIIVIIIIICLKRRKKEKKRKEAERRALRREERRKRRREREERRKQGLPVSDTDSDESTDSGYIRNSSSTLNGGVKGTRRRKRKSRKLGKKFRKIYDENGNLIREEEIPLNPDDRGDEMVYVKTADGRMRRKRRVKKTRQYTREVILPNGDKVTEVVYSDYYETESEHSVNTSEEDDPVLNEIRKAELRRKRERNEMMNQIAERQKDRLVHPGDVPTSEKFGDDPEHQGQPGERPAKRQAKSGDVSGYIPAKPTDGPVVFRPSYEEKVARQEKTGGNKPGFLRRLFKRKHKKKPVVVEDGVDKDVGDRDHYMKQYREKKRIEGKLDDEGYWEDDPTKGTAKDVFDIDKLEAILEGENFGKDRMGFSPHTGYESHIVDKPTEQKIDDRNSTGSRPDEAEKDIKEKDESRPTVKYKKNEKAEKKSGQKHTDDKTKKQVTARVSQLLTQRLFPVDLESKKQRRVIFVEEMKNKQGSLPPLKNFSSQRTLSGPKGPVIIDPKKAAFYREGLAKDQEFIESIEAEDSEVLHHENENGDGTRLSALNRPHLKRFSHGPGKGFRGNIPEAWSVGSSNSNANDKKSTGKVPYTVSAPQFHSYLNFLRGNGQGSTNGSETDRDLSYSGGVSKPRRLIMDDARLRRLLEELYKDKKYMDAIIAAEDCKNEQKVKDLAAHGRDYLIDMALYWEKKGPLPPRPSTTALGFKLERSKSMFKESERDSQRPTLERNKTVC